MTAHFEAKKHAYRQTQEGVVVSFVVHPNDVSSELATAPLGTRYMMAFAEIGDDGKPIQKKAAEKPKEEKRSWSSMSYAQRSGILRNDRQFMNWLQVDNPDDAADIIRRKCGVESCSMIDGIPLAKQKFDAMETQFRQATGQFAEVRS